MEMTIDGIKALIAADESRTLELKKTTGIMDACREQGVEEWDGGFVIVTFKRPKNGPRTNKARN